jgi:transmembrane sensor
MTGSADQVEAQAADFLVRCMEADWSDRDQQELDHWLDHSMAHRAAFWRLEHGAARIDRLSREPEALQADRRIAASSDSGRHWWKFAASIVLMLGAWGGYYAYERLQSVEQPRSVAYATNFGGISNAMLPDRTQLALNSATSVRFEETQSQRVLWLESGEAFFDVAHDSRRPFTVHSGEQSVTVVGTRFSVERQTGKMIVTVLDGKVRVGGADGPMLVRGQSAIASGSSTLIRTEAPEVLERRLSWRTGMLAFTDTPIREAAAQFNRYNERKIIVMDDGVGSTKVGGSFNPVNEDQFVEILQTAYGFRVKESGTEIRVSSR